MAKTNIEKLMELKQLYETGVLTKEELEAEKAKILGNAPKEPESKDLSKEDGHSESVQSQQVSENDTDSVDNEESFFAKYKFYIFGVLAVLAVVLLYVVFSGGKEDKPLYPDGHPIEATDTLVLENLAEKELEEEIDIFNDRLPIKDILKVKDDNNSDRLKRLLIDNGFICKPNDDADNYSSSNWVKTIGNDTAKTNIKVFWLWRELPPSVIEIYMECSDVRVKDKWQEELESLGYTTKEVKVDDKIFWTFTKGDILGGSIFMPNLEETKYSYVTSSSFEEIDGDLEREEQENQEMMQNIEAQAVSMGTLIDDFNNNVNGQASKKYIGNVIVYSCEFDRIKRANGSTKYVMISDDNHGNRSDHMGNMRVYTNSEELANLNFPVTICFKGILQRRWQEDEYRTYLFNYSFLCTEPLTYKY